MSQDSLICYHAVAFAEVKVVCLFGGACVRMHACIHGVWSQSEMITHPSTNLQKLK